MITENIHMVGGFILTGFAVAELIRRLTKYSLF